MNTLHTGDKSPNPKGNKVKATFSETLLSNYYSCWTPVLANQSLEEKAEGLWFLVFVIYSDTEFFESVKSVIVIDTKHKSCMKSNWISINAIMSMFISKTSKQLDIDMLILRKIMGGIHYHPANQGIQSGVIWVDWLCWLKYLSFVNDKILGYHFLVPA